MKTMKSKYSDRYPFRAITRVMISGEDFDVCILPGTPVYLSLPRSDKTCDAMFLIGDLKLHTYVATSEVKRMDRTSQYRHCGLVCK